MLDIWVGKNEPCDFVTCRVCSFRATTLATHLRKHSLTADMYRERFPEARIRCEALTEKRQTAAKKGHETKPRAGLKKIIACPDCGESREVGFTFAPTTHDVRCASCRAEALAKEEEAFWADKTEGLNFVTCDGCGYRAENLTSHVQNAHPEWIGCYPGQMVATNSAVRDKTALKGKTLSDETRAKMSANAGRWNAGLTKETDSRVAGISKNTMGRPAWSKGLTKADHPSLQSTAEKLTIYKGAARPWSNGLEANLSDVDFTPYLDETGAVDRKTMAEELDLSEPTITKYMEKIGLRLSTKYVAARADRATIRLEKEVLLRFTLGNGKVVVAQAMLNLGHDYKVIKRECARHGLKTFNHRIRQTICLDVVSKVLGGVAYRQEWETRSFTNPKSGRRFRFDGFFPSHNLVVEFHGYQHWVFPSVYIRDRAVFDAMQERDRIKQALVEADPMLQYFIVREDEPYADPVHLRTRLQALGVSV